MSERLSPGDAAALTGYRFGSAMVNAMPESMALATASMAGLGFSAAMRGRRSTIERHLRRADPTLRGVALRRAVQEAFDSYARYWVESFRLPQLDATEIDAAFSYDGFGNIEQGLAEGNGVIIALPHLGGWEWAGRWIADRAIPITVVVEELRPPELFEWFVSFRRSLGMNVVPLGPDAGPAVLKALRNNELVCLLSDRDLGGGGVEVEFFGERTKIPAGPATLSLRTGAPILPTGVYFQGRRNHFALVDPPLRIERSGKLRADVQCLTQALANSLEALIKRAPSQWHLFQPNWPSDPGYSS